MTVCARVGAWWGRTVGSAWVGWRLPPEKLVSLMLLWADGSWQIESGIGVGTEPVWQRHGAPADLAALLAEGLGVTWTQAHGEVRPLDPQATLAGMAGHDGSLGSWIDTCLAGGRPFTVTLDSGGGAVATMRPVDWLAAGSSDAVLAVGSVDAGTSNVDLRARDWPAEVDRWDLVARPWLVDTAAWLNGHAGHDWRTAAWWLPEATALRPRLSIPAGTSAAAFEQFLDPVAPSRPDAPTPARYGLAAPAVTGSWLLLLEWAPRSGRDGEPASVLGFVRADPGQTEVRCFHWSLRTLRSSPRSVRVDGEAVWPAGSRGTVETMVRDAVAFAGVPPDWEVRPS